MSDETAPELPEEVVTKIKKLVEEILSQQPPPPQQPREGILTGDMYRPLPSVTSISSLSVFARYIDPSLLFEPVAPGAPKKISGLGRTIIHIIAHTILIFCWGVATEIATEKVAEAVIKQVEQAFLSHPAPPPDKPVNPVGD